MSKKIMMGLFFVAFGVFLTGCTTKGFYMKTVRSKNTQITNNITITVIPENWYWLGTSNFLPRALITEFLDLGFIVIERSQLEKIFHELKLDLSGAVKEEPQGKKLTQGIELGIFDKTSLKKAGELLGVDAFLLTYIVPTYNDNIDKATFRLVNVQTAEVMFSITFINGNRSMDAAGTKEIIETISANIKQLLEGKVKILSGYNTIKGITLKPQIIKTEKE